MNKRYLFMFQVFHPAGFYEPAYFVTDEEGNKESWVFKDFEQLKARAILEHVVITRPTKSIIEKTRKKYIPSTCIFGVDPAMLNQLP